VSGAGDHGSGWTTTRLALALMAFGRAIVRPIIAAAFVVIAIGTPAAAQPHGTFTIYVPSSEDGSWAKTARSVRTALLAEGLVRECDIVYSPGAGGLIGLAAFENAQRGNPSSVLLAGRSMLSAAVHNRSLVSLKNVEPIARLSGADIVIAVDKDSPIRSLNDLTRAIRADGKSVDWVGGSEGGADELLVYQLTSAVGADRRDIEFDAVPGGGDLEVRKFFADRATAIVGSYEEFASYVQRGELRIVAISSERRNPLIDAPTLRELGMTVDDGDWRGVFAPPGLTAAQRGALEKMFARLVQSDSWKRQLEVYDWQDLYLPGAAFGRALDTEKVAIAAIFNQPSQAATRTRLGSRQWQWAIIAALIAAVIAGLAVIGIVAQRIAIRKRHRALQSSLEQEQSERARMMTKLESNQSGVSRHINEEFARWNFTSAEAEIGWLLLKGLSFKEMSVARGTSERTSREQARSVYAKSGLDNRSVFAAYFLEDFFAGGAPSTKP